MTLTSATSRTQDRLVVLGRNDQLLDVLRRLSLVVDDELISVRQAFDTADRLQPMRFANLVGEIGRGEVVLKQVQGSGLDDDFAKIATRDVGVKYILDVLDFGGELVKGVVVQVRGTVSAGQHQRQDRENRRSHLLHGQIGVRRKLRANGADLVPGKRLGPAHIRAWRKVERDFAAAANGFGTDLGHADDGADSRSRA